MSAQSRGEGARVLDEMLAFSLDHVRRLTGLSLRQLRYWDDTGFFSPQYTRENRRRLYSRVYSFRDLVALRTIAELREKITLQELRRIGEWLQDQYETPWASLRFYIVGGKVYFDDPRTKAQIATDPKGQIALTVAVFEMEPIAHNMREAAIRLRQRGPNEVGKITRNRYIMSNAAVLAGTRIPTSAIWNFHVAGYKAEDIVRQYPQLTVDDVQAAIAHETELRHKQVV